MYGAVWKSCHMYCCSPFGFSDDRRVIKTMVCVQLHDIKILHKLCFQFLSGRLYNNCLFSFTKVSRGYKTHFHLTCLSNSIGGCAPYFSLEGMFRSSTNTTHFFPGGGPYTPLRRLFQKKKLKQSISNLFTHKCSARTR